MPTAVHLHSNTTVVFWCVTLAVVACDSMRGIWLLPDTAVCMALGPCEQVQGHERAEATDNQPTQSHKIHSHRLSMLSPPGLVSQHTMWFTSAHIAS